MAIELRQLTQIIVNEIEPWLLGRAAHGFSLTSLTAQAS
jgi:hypothetical protein